MEGKSQDSKKKDMREDTQLPRNQEYLSYYVYQGEWRPTTPLGPVGAEYSSPGPAIVNLPPTIGEENHDFSRAKAPGYKIGHKLPQPEGRKIGPGPAKYNLCGMTSQGRDECKAPKFGKALRFRDKAPFLSPGPAEYSRDEGDKSVYPTAPAFSMPRGDRSKLRPVTSPAPNAYSLPPALGPGKTPLVTGPAYSIGKGQRSTYGKPSLSPGPAAYMLPSSNKNMSKAPAYSMGSKAHPPAGATYTPGPAAHNAHLSKFDKYSTPRITFGIRHSPYKAYPGFAAEK